MPEAMIRFADGRKIQAYLSVPGNARSKSCGIAMQQIFVVNPGMRGFTDDFAAHGYVSICSALFWRQQPGVQIVRGEEGTFARALVFARGFYNAAVTQLANGRTASFLRYHFGS